MLFPPVTTDLCRDMQPTLYRYVWNVSASQQLRLCALTLIVTPLAMVPLELQRRIVNVAIDNRDISLLTLLGLVYLAVIALNAAFKYARGTYLSVIAEGVIRVIRKRVTANNGDPPEDAASKGGSKVSIAAAEAEQIGGFVAEAIATPLLEGGTFVVVLAYMVVIEPLIAAYTIALLVPIVVVVPTVQRFIDKFIEKRIGLVRELGDEIGSNDQAPPGHETTSRAEFNDLIESIYRVRVKIVLLKHGLKVFSRFLNNLGPLGVLMIGGWLVIKGETELGTIVAFISGFDRLRAPSRELLSFYRLWSQMRVQYRLFREATS